MSIPIISPAPPKFRGCLLSQSTGQSIPNSTTTVLDFDQPEYDTDGFHENVLNPERITIPAGVNKVRLYAGLDNVNRNAGLRLYKNGADSFLGRVYGLSYEWKNNYFTSAVLEVSEGDYFDIRAYQSSGSGQTTNTYGTIFGCEVLG